jgi:cytochrome b involved in lipid metabolism
MCYNLNIEKQIQIEKGVLLMEKFNMIIVEEYGNEFEILACKLTSQEVEEAIKEFNLYMRKQGKVYDMDYYKEPSAKNFFMFYFGEEDYDYEYGEIYKTPDIYILSDLETAERFYRLASFLEYHDKYSCDVTQEENFVDIVYGEY